jgi:CheY-like chemotaxis protein
MPSEDVAVLLVEDNPADVTLARLALAGSEAGRFRLTVAGHLDEAVVRLRAEPWDAILLDLSLPGSEGLDTFAAIHATAPDLPIVVLTGLEDERLAVQAVRAGAQDYLVKGEGDGRALSRAVRYAIERKRLEREKAELITRLEVAAASIRTLRGLLPICASCKMIRNDSGYWQQLEEYITTHSEAEFTHGLCPECLTIYLGEPTHAGKR